MDNNLRKSKMSFTSDQWSTQNQTLSCKKSIEELTSQEHLWKKWTRSGRVKQSTTNWKYVWSGPQHSPLASYGSESWTFFRKAQKKLYTFEVWTYRSILRVSWTEKRTNQWVLQKLTTKMMLFEQIISRKLRFFGDAMRHDGLEKTTIQGKVGDMRGRGRPLTAWHSDIEEEEDHSQRGTLTSRSGLDANCIKHSSWQSTVIEGVLSWRPQQLVWELTERETETETERHRELLEVISDQRVAWDYSLIGVY